MNLQKLKKVFEEKIKPELGRIQSQEKYLRVITELAANSGANKGKGIRAAQISDEVQPVSHTLNKLADRGFVEITLPIGDGTLIVDPINNRRELFRKTEMIEKYLSNFRRHLNDDSKARKIAKETLSIEEDWKLEAWLSQLDRDVDFKEYNMVVFKLLERGLDLKTRFYGPLLWRKMAKYYNISEKTKDLLEER